MGRMEGQHGCIMRKVVSKEVTAGGRFDFLLDSALFLYLTTTSSKISCPLTTMQNAFTTKLLSNRYQREILLQQKTTFFTKYHEDTYDVRYNWGIG